MRSEREKKQKFKSVDWITILIVLGLVAFGLITIANVWADPFTGQEQGLQDIVEKLNFEYVKKQIVNFLVGLAALLVLLVIDYNLYRSFIKYVYIVNVALLVFLLLSGASSRGVMGWFNLGARAFQPSELCKISMCAMVSNHVSKAVDRDGSLKSLKDIAIALGYFAVPFVLVVAQPDMGTAFVLLCLFICILFIAKISWKYIAGAAVAAGALMPLSYFFVLNDDQKARIDVFLNPSQADPTGDGMHVLRSMESIGSGQLTGKGYFTEGTLAQLKYVPERHTDFVFSSIVEGLGFIGGTVLIVVFFLLILRWLWVALHAKDFFGTCLVIGCMGMLLAHVFENIGMTIGLMPITGIPLPFISYGGSNLLANMMAVGIVLNVWMRRQQRR